MKTLIQESIYIPILYWPDSKTFFNSKDILDKSSSNYVSLLDIVGKTATVHCKYYDNGTIKKLIARFTIPNDTEENIAEGLLSFLNNELNS